MTRVKRGKISLKRRRKILKYTKGFRFGGKSKESYARERLLHAWTNMFRSRRLKKRDMRRLWQIKINAALRLQGLSYSKFIGDLKKKNIKLDRKIIASLAEFHPKVFTKIVEKTKDRK